MEEIGVILALNFATWVAFLFYFISYQNNGIKIYLKKKKY